MSFTFYEFFFQNEEGKQRINSLPRKTHQTIFFLSFFKVNVRGHVIFSLRHGVYQVLSY